MPGGTVTQWTWVRTEQYSAIPVTRFSYSGRHTYHRVGSEQCGGLQKRYLFKTFERIYPKPVIAMQFNNACNSIPVNFTGERCRHHDHRLALEFRRWLIGQWLTGATCICRRGYLQCYLVGRIRHSCPSGTINRNIIIYSNTCLLQATIPSLPGSRFPLHATGGVRHSWSPATGLNDANSANLVASSQSTQTFIVKPIPTRAAKATMMLRRRFAKEDL